jgi:cytochrome P450
MSVTPRVNGTAPPEVALSDIDLGSWDFWGLDDDIREGAFATLRREAPISFFPQLTPPGIPVGRGHWALTRHADVYFVSRHPEIFSSAPNITMEDLDPEAAEYHGSMLMMDDPRHQRLRSIVSRAFTPKVLARIEESIRHWARHFIAAMIVDHPDGTAELVSEFSGRFPLQVICDMMGIAEQDRPQMAKWADAMLGLQDRTLPAALEAYVKASVEMGAYGNALAEDRRAHPGEDLTTSLVQAEVDGERLTSAEIASFFILLVFAGIETSRNAISHGVLALSRFPEQRHHWWSDFGGVRRTAVEEIVRWASPVIYMRRTLVEDIRLGDTQMASGDKVTMWYSSANRDEAKFVNPWMFDVRRNPNPHFGFGGGGVHFCLGANLARREIDAAFSEFHRLMPDVTATEEPVRLESPFVNGIKRMPVSWTQ